MTTTDIDIVAEFKAHGGRQLVVRHQSAVCACPMTFAVFLPPQADSGPCPTLTYLSGLTCTHANVMEKGEYRQAAAKHGIILVCPDTSPRSFAGGDVADHDAYFAGQGAGMYVNATQPPFATHFQMETYIVEELPQVLRANFNISDSAASIFGHSMGGHGAITLALKHPGTYRSVSAFAPIAAASQCPWGEHTLPLYLGVDRQVWRKADAVALIEDGARLDALLVDQGLADSFLEEQLKPELLTQACARAGIDLTLRHHAGYDHSYYFISSFMDEHIAWHAARLRG